MLVEDSGEDDEGTEEDEEVVDYSDNLIGDDFYVSYSSFPRNLHGLCPPPFNLFIASVLTLTTTPTSFLKISPEKSEVSKTSYNKSTAQYLDETVSPETSKLAVKIARAIEEEQNGINRGIEDLRGEAENEKVETFEALKINAAVIAVSGSWLQVRFYTTMLEI